MTIYILLFGVLLGLGLFFIAADLLKLPTLATEKAMMLAGKQAKSKPETIDTLLHSAAVKLSKYIPMDEYKKSRMANVLSAAGFSETPELFTVMAIVNLQPLPWRLYPALWCCPF